MNLLSPDSFGARPTSDFYSLNSYSTQYAPEEDSVEVNHYSQEYLSYTLENMPVKTGTYVFYVHSGLRTIRFSEVDTVPTGTPLHTYLFGSNLQNSLKQFCVMYQNLGTLVQVTNEWNAHVIKVY